MYNLLPNKKYTLPWLFTLVSIFTIFSACKKELDAPTPLPFETGMLVASEENLVINTTTPGDEALRLTWDAFPNSMVSYKLVLFTATNSDTVSVASGAISRRFNHGELNNLIVENLEMEIGTTATLSFKLLGFINSKGLDAESNTVTIQVTPAATGAAYSELWVVGGAAPAGWNIDNPNPMKKDPTNPFQFKFNDVFTEGEFKIPTSTGNWGTDFFMPLENHPSLTSTGVQLVPGGNPDYKWYISTPGAYKILLNISAAPFIEIKPFTPFAKLYMVGDATPAGWNIDGPTPLTATPGNPYEFTYTGPMSAGEFKVPTSTGNWNGDFFMPVTNGEGVTSTDAIFVPGGQPDNKWKITEAGNYKIVLNQLKETISITKL